MRLSFASAAVAAFLGCASTASAMSSNEYIVTHGNMFFYNNNGSQFYLQGVAYQSNSITNSTTSESFTDPLADITTCKRDLPYLLKLNTNVLRVYAINTSLAHDDCMNLFADNGIYVISDLSEPGESINRNDPAWTVDLLNRYTDVVDALGKYTNTLGFFAGNEVANLANNTVSDAYVKAALRDTKAYIAANINRPIPVGYSAADVADIRVQEATYFACGDSSVRADFYGLNMYEWCDAEDTYSSSGYETTTNALSNLSIPLFFSEYGCNVNKPRTFTEVKVLYGSDMNSVWSGGIVYMYFQEDNDYGLVSVSGTSVSTLTDFSYLSNEMATISPTIRHSSDVTASSHSIACPTTDSKWLANSVLPPTPNESLCSCMTAAAGCVVKSSVDSEDYQAIFDYVCGVIDCTGINSNGTTGEYGAYAGCDAQDQLNWVLNAYYAHYSSKASVCDFSGSATLQSGATGSACTSLLSAAGTSGAGTVAGSIGSTSKVSSTATGKSSSTAKASGSSTKSSSGSSASSSSKNLAIANTNNMNMAAGIFAVAAAGIIGFL